MAGFGWVGLEGTGDGLPVDAQFAGDPALGPAALVQGEEGVDESHSEVIRHDGSPRTLGTPSSVTGEPCSPQSGWFSSAPRWLVLSAR
jgi:hypothetical protein